MKIACLIPTLVRGNVFCRRTYLRVIAASCAAVAFVCFSVAMAQRASDRTTPVKDEVDLALEHCLLEVLSSGEAVSNSDELEAAVNATFVMQYPDLALREAASDPDFVSSQEQAFSLMENSDGIEAELAKDPIIAQERAEAQQDLIKGISEGTAKFHQSMAIKVKELNQAAKSAPELINPTEWRREREEAIRALIPRADLPADLPAE